MAREIEAISQTKTRVQLTEPRNNALAEYFFDLSTRVSDTPNKQEALKKLGWPDEQLNQLFARLEQLFGLTLEEQENLYDFFHRISAFFYQEMPITGNTITHGEVPSNLKEMLQALEERERLVAEIRDKTELSKILERYGLSQTEIDKVISRILEQRTEQITTVTSVDNIPLTTTQTEEVVFASFQTGTVQQTTIKGVIPQPEIRKTIVDQVRKLAKTNQFSTATTAVAYRIANPSPELPQSLSESITTTLPPEALNQIAAALTLTAHETADQSGIAPLIATPTIAIVLSNHNVSLTEKEGTQLVQGMITSVTPILKAIAKDMTPTQIRQDAQNNVEQIVIGHLANIGLDPSAETVTPAVELAVQTLTSLPTYFSRAVAVTPMPRQKTLVEQTNNLPAKPINIFHVLRPGKNNPPAILYTITQLAQTPKLQELVDVWQKFYDYVQEQPAAKTISSDPAIAYWDTVYKPGGTACQVSESPNYAIMETVRPVTDFGQHIAKSRFNRWVKKKIPIKKLTGKLTGKIKTKFYKYAAEKIVKRLAEKGVLVTAEKAAELLAGETLAVALATALGIPTGGASILIWLGAEALRLGWSLIKKIAEKLKIPEVLNFFTLGLSTKLRDILGKIPVLKWFKDIIYYPVGIILAIGTVTTVVPLALIFVLVFGVLFFINLGPMQMYNQTLAPPIERGITEEELIGEIRDMLPFESDVGYCQSINNQSAKVACYINFILQDCNISAVTNNSMNMTAICLRASQTLQQLIGSAERIIDTFKISLAWDGTLQCVGFKRAVEQNLPACGDAKHFVGSGCGQCTHVYSPGENMAAIQIGDNTIWTSGAYGHIAIVIGADLDSGMVQVAQAWGGSGRINFKSVPVASVAEFIRCH